MYGTHGHQISFTWPASGMENSDVPFFDVGQLTTIAYFNISLRFSITYFLTGGKPRPIMPT